MPPHNVRNGFLFPLTLFISLAFLLFVLGALSLSMTQLKIAKMEALQVQCRTLAETGLANGLARISADTTFFTDPDYTGTTENLKAWVIQTAVGSLSAIAPGRVKVIKEQHRSRLFVVGYLGTSIQAATARKTLQLDYEWANGAIQRKRWRAL